MDKIVQWFTAGRAIAAALTVLAGGVGTGVGFLLGEGAARASFVAQFDTLKAEVVTLKKFTESQSEQNLQILTSLAEIKGEVRALRREVRP